MALSICGVPMFEVLLYSEAHIQPFFTRKLYDLGSWLYGHGVWFIHRSTTLTS